MSTDQTKEPQYQATIALRDTNGLSRLGVMANMDWHNDPRRLIFMMSRYKFVAKMLAGKQQVLEVGCGDAFATRIVLQEVGEICAIDFDPVLVRDVHERMDDKWRFDCRVHDMLTGSLDGPFDAAYALDVLEHISVADEHRFMYNIARSLVSQGVLVIGSPSIQSQPFAAWDSKKGHVNCKDSKELQELMQAYFHNVFMYSMNDEVIHTGFYPMAQYLFAIGVGVRSD